MAPEINSSLDLFLLGLIQSGVNTPYLLRERARLSVGATLPALERLQKNRFISRSEKGLRNKQEFELHVHELRGALGWRCCSKKFEPTSFPELGKNNLRGLALGNSMLLLEPKLAA